MVTEDDLPYHEGLVKGVAVKIITTSTTGVKIQGSGVIYNTGSDFEYSYIFTALHCVWGKRTKVAINTDSNFTFEYDLTGKVKEIEIKFRFYGDDEIKIITLQPDCVIDDPRRDFAVLMVTREDLLKLHSDIPTIFLSRKTHQGKSRSLGYPKIRSEEEHHLLLESKYASNNKDTTEIEILSHLSGEDAMADISGYSGSGLFIDQKPVLHGLITRALDERLVGNRLTYRPFKRIPFENLIKERAQAIGKKLASVVFIDSHQSLKVESGGQVINFEKTTIKFKVGDGVRNVLINIPLAILRLNNDMRDDWFPDPLNFKDMLNAEFIYDRINYYNQSGGFSPEKALHFDIPKNGFTARYSMETTLLERVIYQGLVDNIAEDIDEHVTSPNVFSSRYNTNPKDKEYLFFNSIEQWKKFLHQTKMEMDDLHPVLVVADLTNFYENINIEHLAGKLQHYVINYLPVDTDKKEFYQNSIEMIRQLLVKWSSHSIKSGIPQNRDASAFLANTYLSDIDREMVRLGRQHQFTYHRYLDDIRMVCSNEYTARRALKILIRELRRFGLNVNSKKTFITSDARAYMPENDIKLDQINNLLRARRARDVQIAVHMTNSLFYEAIGTGNTEEAEIKNRKFSFCIERILRFARTPLLNRSIDFKPVVSYVVNELTNQPWATASFVRLLKSINPVEITAENWTSIKDVILDSQKNLYEWQTYHLWMLLAYHKHTD